MKKLIFVISFIVLSGFLFGFSTPDTKAATAAELQALIQQLQEQIASLKLQLSQLQQAPVTWCHTFNVNLKYGDSGDEVKALQVALHKEGFTPIPYQEGDKNYGNFEDYTASAVVAFQEKYASEVLAPWGLTHGTGFVGPTTRAKLNELYGCELSCRTYWWYNDDHQYCQQAQFCGDFMYAGLHTFSTEAECKAALGQPSITVVSPNGGERWVAGNKYNITWKTTLYPTSSKVGLQLCDTRGVPGSTSDRSLCREITDPVTNSGRYSWTIPSQLLGASIGGENIYKIEAMIWPDGLSGPALYDYSNGAFSIAATKGFCGDVSGDGYVYLNDVSLLQNYVGYPGKYSISSEWAADVNCDGVINMGDVVLLRNYISYPGKYVLHCCGGTCGDVNGNGIVNIGDSTLCYNHVKSPIVYPFSNPWAADVNCDKRIDNNDCNLIMNYVGYPGKYTLNCCSEKEKSITVVSPNGGEKWMEGNTYKVVWDQAGLDRVKINIELLAYKQDGTPIGMPYAITTDIFADQEYYSWTIPAKISDQFGLPPDKYKVRLANYKGGIAVDGEVIDGDESDYYFAIVPARVACTDSDGGRDYFVKGKISGLYNGYINNFYDYCENSNVVHEFFCEGSEIKEALYTCSYSCRDGACQAGITIISPDGGEKWEIGKTYDINWASEGTNYSTVHVNIYLWKGGTFVKTIALGVSPSTLGGSPSVGKYSWKIPSDLTPGSDYQIRLYASGIAKSDISDNYFSIVSGTDSTCVDTDGGKNYYVEGSGGGWKTDTEWEYFGDGCYLNDNRVASCSGTGCYLAEKYCEGKYVRTENYTCPYGCKDGACLKKCTDSDGGKNYYTKGTVTVEWPGHQTSAVDFCGEGTTLYEGYCEDGELQMVSYNCPYGCSDGACVER